MVFVKITHALFGVGSGCLLVGVILNILSAASREWTSFSDGSTSGLWTECTAAGACVPVNSTDWLVVVRAMMILSIIVSGTAVFAVAIHVVYVCRKKVNRIWVTIVGTFLTFFAVVLNVIGILFYHIKIWSEAAQLIANLRHGYSFWLCVAATVLFFLTAFFLFITSILIFLSRKKEHKRDNILTTANYNWKADNSDNDMYMRSNMNDYLGKKDSYFVNNDYIYYNSMNTPPGVYRYGGTPSRSHERRYNSDFRISPVSSFRQPILYIA
uniref:Uncharacterized protein n=1 Tax=Arion vulgaris TaxID=1028688 RepID=A0A0B6Z9T8_9EUPU